MFTSMSWFKKSPSRATGCRQARAEIYNTSRALIEAFHALRALWLRLFTRFDWSFSRASRALIGTFYALWLGLSTRFSRFDGGFSGASRASVEASHALRALWLGFFTLRALSTRFDWDFLRASHALIGTFYALLALWLGLSTRFACFDWGFI